MKVTADKEMKVMLIAGCPKDETIEIKKSFSSIKVTNLKDREWEGKNGEWIMFLVEYY